MVLLQVKHVPVYCEPGPHRPKRDMNPKLSGSVTHVAEPAMIHEAEKEIR